MPTAAPRSPRSAADFEAGSGLRAQRKPSRAGTALGLRVTPNGWLPRRSRVERRSPASWSSHNAAQPSRSSNGRPAPLRRRSRPGKSRLKAVGEDRSDGARSSRPSARPAPARTGGRPPCPAFTTGVLSVRANTTMAGALPGDRDRRRRGCVCRREQEPPACSTGASDGRHGQSSARGARRGRAAPRRDAAAGAHRWMDRRRRGSRSPRSMDRAALRSHVHALRSGPRAPDPARGIE